MTRICLAGCMVLSLVACKPKATNSLPDLSSYPVVPAPGALHRLSTVEYTDTIADIVSPSIVVPLPLDADLVVDNMVSVGQTTETVSPTGVSRYEAAALSIAKQTVASASIRHSVVGCTPASVSDQTCLTSFVNSFGLRAWRRPLQPAESTPIVQVGASAAMALNDPWQGIAAAMADLLESPYFIFRVELGEPIPGGSGNRYSNYEMASRLAAFLTASTPDAQLLQAAAQGQLVTDAGLKAQVERLLASPAAHKGMQNFFTDVYGLNGLKQLNQEPSLYPAMSSSLGPDALQETMMDLDHIVFDLDGDFRIFFTGNTTYVNPLLSAVYDIPAPSLTGYAKATFPKNSLRAGFLGQTSFLALYAHPTTTSPVLRGKFVRTVLLCDTVPPPPAGVNTGLEPVSTAAPTMRARDQEHLQIGTICAGCHTLMDPIGLGFENFDAVGVSRTQDNGYPIDASGQLDGVNFSGPIQLGQAVVASPKFAKCFAQELYEYAKQAPLTPGDTGLATALGEAFISTGYHVKDLMEVVALSSGFRLAGAPQ